MSWKVTAALILALFVAGVGSAAAQNEDPGKFDKGSLVTIQGCVRESLTKGAYVLTRVQEWPVANSPNGKYGPRHYWVDTLAAEFKNRVGQTIQLRGKIISVKKSKIDMTPGRKRDLSRIEIERPDIHIAATPHDAGLQPGRSANSDDQQITLLKLRISEILTVMKTCLPES